MRALTRVENVAQEQELLELARRATGAQLERIVGAYRGVVAVEAGHERARERRCVHWHYDDDGSLVLTARLPAEEGAIVVAALEAARDELNKDRFEDLSPQAPSDAHDTSSADGMDSAEADLASSGGQAAPSDATPRGPGQTRSSRGRPRPCR